MASVVLKSGKSRVSYGSAGAAQKAARVGSSIFKTRFCVIVNRKVVECWKNGRRVHKASR